MLELCDEIKLLTQLLSDLLFSIVHKT